jgi:hypothetical protein
MQVLTADDVMKFCKQSLEHHITELMKRGMSRAEIEIELHFFIKRTIKALEQD